MKSYGRWFFVLVFVLMAPGLAQAQSLPQTTDPQQVAQALVDHLIAGEYEQAAQDFDDTMSAALPPATLQQIWESLLAQVGPFQAQVGDPQAAEVEGSTIVVITLQFEKAAINVQTSVSAEGQVGGLYFYPVVEAWEPPDYADSTAFSEQEITLNPETEWALPGLLTLPTGQGPFPAVVLVHGSGPGDRDETIGPNKPFRDLAWGLASQGIAVLRYDKRTLVYGQQMAVMPGLTVQEETIDDALAAVDFLKTIPAIDPARVFVLGHSLGGYLSPRIAAQNPTGMAGIISLAGNTRPLEVLTLEQVEYLLSLQGELSESDQAQLEAMGAEAEALAALDENTDPTATYLGIPAAYWLDLREYDPVAVAQGLDLPMLILQGERDYQVTLDDFAGWQAGLGQLDRVTFTTYPDLNHLFMPGEGLSTPAEYNTAGHVSAQVITDIAHWIESH